MITAVQQLHELSTDSMHVFYIYSADECAEKPIKVTMSAEHNGKVTCFYYQKKDYYVKNCLQAEPDLKQ